MHIGFVGLGKMGGNMVKRLLRDGHHIVVYNRTPDKVEALVKEGAVGAGSVAEVIEQLPSPKVVWLMVPAGAAVEENIDECLKFMSAGDIIVDGGNSYWRDTQRRAARIAEKNVEYVDCGTSGGIWGLQNGYCLMYGGKKSATDHLQPIFTSLAPENGHLYCGTNGAGHFIKMVHNGIEYGMMQAYAEGFEIIEKSPFGVDLQEVSKVWMHGSVVRSWLLELAVNAFEKDPKLSGIKDYVQDSGEGRWTIQTAIDFDVPAHVITASLFTRFQSRQDESFAMKVLAALRNEFGGHEVKKK